VSAAAAVDVERTNNKGTLKEKFGMRTFTINLLATALLLFGASSASAYSFDLVQSSGPGTATILVPSDVITFDLYANVDQANTQAFQLAVLFDNDAILTYDIGASSAPLYILYTGGKGATYLNSNSGTGGAPLWGSDQQPGQQQVNVAFTENALGFAPKTGNNIWIATLVFHVGVVGDGQSTIELALLGNGSTVVSVGTGCGGVVGCDISGSVELNGSYTFSTIPEPTTALLIGFGLVGLTLAGRRQS
jgi:hypothetical protein